MTLAEIKSKIIDKKFDKCFHLLYDETEAAGQRYLSACEEFEKYFKDSGDVSLFSAPGRTEVGGNHTDHQHGWVLAGSVNLDVIAVVSPNSDNTVRVKSEGYPMDEVDLAELDPKSDETGKSASLIRGMCALFKQAGYNIGGFDAYTTSNVLKGSGLSSSAAFEVLIGFILNGLFNNGEIDAVEIAKFAQKAENIYFGKPCGLMDQMASAVGGFTAIDFFDPENPVIEKIEFDLAALGHSLCIVNTGGNHANLTHEYAAITQECRAISKWFNKEHLRHVDEAEFYANIANLRKECGDRAVLRAMHFFAENNRAFLEKEALKKGDFCEFLRLVKASGNSSFKYLQNIYSNSNVSEQGLSLALALSERYLSGRGACRVHGGGFAGTIQCFVPSDMLNGYKSMIESVFGQGSCYILNIRTVGGYALEADR